MSYAPIVLFVYSRLDHTKNIIKYLKNNNESKDSDLIIFSDHQKNNNYTKQVSEVRKYIKTIKGFKSIKIIQAKKNLGLAKSIIKGVTQTVNKYGKIIVLEDDLIISPYFLKFMNDALEIYKDDKEVVSVSGYIYPCKSFPPTFFVKCAENWGWATWSRGWSLFRSNGKELLQELKTKNKEYDFNYSGNYDYVKMLEDFVNNKNDSWAVRWYASVFLANKLTLYPRLPLSRSLGIDGSGTHGGVNDIYYNKLSDKPVCLNRVTVEEDIFSRKQFEKFFSAINSKPFRLASYVKTLSRKWGAIK